MIARLLAHFGVAVIHLDDIARHLASDMLYVHGYELHTLERNSTQAELQRRYVQVAVAHGLPTNIARRVAALTWRYIEDAQRDPLPVDSDGFTFYD